jgi:hypothetical protein
MASENLMDGNCEVKNSGLPDPTLEDMLAEVDWEVVPLVCPAGHQRKMSIMKGCPVRNTYCTVCGKAVLLKRVSAEADGLKDPGL